MIIDLDGMRGGERAPVLDRQLRPRGMSHGDESARFPRPGRQHRPGFVRFGRGKIERQSGRDNVPIFARRRRHGVNLSPDQGGEVIRAQVAGIGDRPIEAAEKMIGQLEEIVARALVGLDHVLGLQGAVGEGRMGVQVPAPEAPWRREGENAHGRLGCRLRGAGSSLSHENLMAFLGIKDILLCEYYEYV